MHFELGILSEKIKNLKKLSDEISSKMAVKKSFEEELFKIYPLISEIDDCMSNISNEAKKNESI